MSIIVRKYADTDLPEMKVIWNEIVEEANSFPQEKPLNDKDAAEFFANQSYTGVAEYDGAIAGLYILHPNNIGRCGHIANASYAVKKEQRGKHIGEALVKDSIKTAAELSFRILQFNAVVASNHGAIHLYNKLNFKPLGTIPGGFRMGNGTYEDIMLFYREEKNITNTTRHAPDIRSMPDVQNHADNREVPLSKVGVKGLEYPIQVLDKIKKIQHTTATVDLFADLPQHFKGTHMSRFVEIFHQYREDLSMPRFLEMLSRIREELDSESAFGSMTFLYFVEKKAPVSLLPGLLSYRCRYRGRVSKQSGAKNFTVAVSVPVNTVCPCSKAISGRGAHNQRGIVTVELELGPFFWLEDIITLVENAASSPVYSLIKREDEKYITEHAYDNPRFVEDLVREVYVKIREMDQFPRFSVEAENFESIHNHSAYAFAEYP